MASAATITATSPGPAEQISTRVAFFIAGFGVAAWAPLVPFAKARADLDEGTLGLLLLCLGVGSIMAMPASGALVARFGCRSLIIASSVLMCLTLPLLAVVSNFALLGATLLVFGAGLGLLDCVINIQAVIVERASGRTMMSGFHGLFSVGGIAGSAGVTALLSVGASPLLAALFVVAFIAACSSTPRPHFCPMAPREAGPPSRSHAASCCSSASSASSCFWPKAPCWIGAPYS